MRVAAGCGVIQPSSQARSTIAHSISLIVTASSLIVRTQASSQGAGQSLPVSSGKLLVECRRSLASSPVAAVHEVVPVGDEVAERAARVAERHAARHAAARLLAHLALGRVQVHVAVVAAGARAARAAGRAAAAPRGIRADQPRAPSSSGSRSAAMRSRSCGMTSTNCATDVSQSASSAAATSLPVSSRWRSSSSRSAAVVADGAQQHHVAVDAARVLAVRIPEVGDAARHAGGEVAADRAEHRDEAARHVLAAVAPDALDDGGRARVAHGEALAARARARTARPRSRRRASCCRRRCCSSARSRRRPAAARRCARPTGPCRRSRWPGPRGRARARACPRRRGSARPCRASRSVSAPSASASGPRRRTISPESSAPIARSVLRTARSTVTCSPRASASPASASTSRSSGAAGAVPGTPPKRDERALGPDGRREQRAEVDACAAVARPGARGRCGR